MDLDDVLALVTTGAVLVAAVACLVAVVYIRRVNRTRVRRGEESRYLDLLVKLVTRIGIGQAVLLAFLAYITYRLFYPDSPRIGAGWSTLWLGGGIILIGTSPISFAIQFARDRRLGRLRAETLTSDTASV